MPHFLLLPHFNSSLLVNGVNLRSAVGDEAGDNWSRAVDRSERSHPFHTANFKCTHRENERRRGREERGGEILSQAIYKNSEASASNVADSRSSDNLPINWPNTGII
jgi:hypothetical protein